MFFRSLTTLKGKVSTLASICILFIVGCQRNNNTDGLTRFHDDGRAKPVVVVVPMIDSTCYDLSWNLSEELSSIAKRNLLKEGAIYAPKQTDEIMLPIGKNPFGKDLSWIKTKFKPNEFVVFLEIIEHEDVPILKNNEKTSKIPEIRRSAYNLNMAVRIRIIDIRRDNPQIVLQEKIKDKYYVANTIDTFDYNKTLWGSKEYECSPMGKAHSSFIKQITKRINDYIMLAKSR